MLKVAYKNRHTSSLSFPYNQLRKRHVYENDIINSSVLFTLKKQIYNSVRNYEMQSMLKYVKIYSGGTIFSKSVGSV